MSELAYSGAEATRRRLTEKQADTVDRLTIAVVEVLSREGYSGTTIRLVAAEAGVGTATAYTYFSSKEHLISEVYWRRLAATPLPEMDGLDRVERVDAILRQIAMLLADEPALAAAVSNALLGDDPDVKHLRVRIGAEIRRRIQFGLGTDDQESLDILELLYSGALLRGGMGHMSYSEVADLLAASAKRLLS
ncbi:TetR/AcrR family transcriptional regulator [Nocardia sp. NBC_00565]|uniref:TetR/AcrR family transcriptional regulator n=1 Tax=Nocardia sp. NBC_00565 TaxID=2975993 RepID=UPI002E8227C1|nr:helix-turn-helix domain-containing protein [Nocardia sp. NBC_00565]WUC06972.1 TetR/AcrR family transcriptional regulator [Nocardia sp. NBC_00565]